MESVPCKLILVFSIIREPFGPTGKGLRESRGIGCELAAGVDIYYSKGGLPPFPNRCEVSVVCVSQLASAFVCNFALFVFKVSYLDMGGFW